MKTTKGAKNSRPLLLKDLRSDLLRAIQRERQAGFFTVRGGASDDAGLHSLVNRGQDIGKRLARVGFLAFDEGIAQSFFHAAQAGIDGAVVQLFARAAAHTFFG